MTTTIVAVAYLIATILFITGLKGLTKPSTARRGNALSALGMLIAIVATLWQQGVVDYPGIIISLIIGAIIVAKIYDKGFVSSLFFVIIVLIILFILMIILTIVVVLIVASIILGS